MKLKILTATVKVVITTLIALSISTTHAQNPALKQRTDAPAALVDPGRFVIDVVVTDKKGQRVLGLAPQDFLLADNKQPQKILTFSSVVETLVNSTTPGAPATAPKVSVEPTEILLVIDSVNVSFTQQGYMRDQTIKFLRGNGGRLTAPTRLVFFTSAGIQVQNQPTLDGNALADLLEKVGAKIRVQNQAMGANGEVERFELSAQNFSVIVENQVKTPGRKLLLWLGPGWPLISKSFLVFNSSDLTHNYDAIVSLLNRMREARVEVISIRNDADDASNSILYQDYLKPVRKKSDADSANLALQVLAINSGGIVTDPSNDLAGQITRCVDDANSYYTLRYTPTETGKPFTYHSIDVKVNRPGLVARAIAGYYEGP